MYAQITIAMLMAPSRLEYLEAAIIKLNRNYFINLSHTSLI